MIPYIHYPVVLNPRINDTGGKIAFELQRRWKRNTKQQNKISKSFNINKLKTRTAILCEKIISDDFNKIYNKCNKAVKILTQNEEQKFLYVVETGRITFQAENIKIL